MFIYFRFATEEYTNDPDVISNNFIHLTNFSINKESGNFVNNSNPEEPEVKVSTYNNKLFHSDFKGSKWTLTSLWKYFRSRGIDTDSIWTKSRYLLKNWLRMFQFFDLSKIINILFNALKYFCLVIDIVIKSILSAHEQLTSVFREQVG